MGLWILGLLAGAGLLLLFVSLLLRARTQGRYEIKGIDIILALMPVVLWLVATGYIRELNLFGIGIKTEKAITDAFDKPIASEVRSFENIRIDDVVHVRTVERGPKGGVERIPELIERKTEALDFELGYGKYYAPAIKTYFESLLAHASLKYVIVSDRTQKLFGIYDAVSLITYLGQEGSKAYWSFEKALNVGDSNARTKLASLPGFIPADQAVQETMSRREILKQMDRFNADILPVIDKRQRFVGIIRRSDLTTRLLLDITKGLEEKP